MELSNSFEHGSVGVDAKPMDFNALQAIWTDCTKQLSDELPPQQFNTWIRPLKVQLFAGDGILAEGSSIIQRIQLVAPNRFIEDWVKNKFLVRIEALFSQFGAIIAMLRLSLNLRRHQHLSPKPGKQPVQ